jgi:hypothetical protein
MAIGPLCKDGIEVERFFYPRRSFSKCNAVGTVSPQVNFF